MRTPKKSYYAIMAGIFCAYALSYWVVREKSYTDAHEVRTGLRMSERDKIMLGVWPSEVAEFRRKINAGIIPKVRKDAEKYAQEIDRRAKKFKIFYAPLRWIDRTITGVEI